MRTVLPQHAPGQTSRRPRRALIVQVGGEGNEVQVERLRRRLVEIGIEVTHLGRQTDAGRIAAAALEHEADAIELCIAERGAVQLLRQLLRELIRLDRRDVSLVVHRLGIIGAPPRRPRSRPDAG